MEIKIHYIKTLLIIDEAHKLYSIMVLLQVKTVQILEKKMIQNSYKNWKMIVLMGFANDCNPYTEDSMELVTLLNLLRLEKICSGQF
jgi:hypothetical protein